MFKYIENANPMKAKQLHKGIEQLMDEGVAQLFTHQFNGRKIIGTVGQLQFEVIQYRLLHEYGAQCRWEPLNLYKACWIESDDEKNWKNLKTKIPLHGLRQGRKGCFSCRVELYSDNGTTRFQNIRFHFNSEF